jgi:DNA-binding YbaB/EbfC family protein
MRGGLGNIMKQAQQMQEQMKKIQDELGSLTITGKSGGGMVTVEMTCRHDVRSVTIDPSLLGDDKEVLEDLVAAALNDAVRKVEQTVQEKMSGIAGGLNIPGLNLPF